MENLWDIYGKSMGHMENLWKIYGIFCWVLNIMMKIPTGWGPQSSERQFRNAYIISVFFGTMVYGRYNELVFMGGSFLWFTNHFPIFSINVPQIFHRFPWLMGVISTNVHITFGCTILQFLALIFSIEITKKTHGIHRLSRERSYPRAKAQLARSELVFMGGSFLWFINHFPIFSIDFPQTSHRFPWLLGVISTNVHITFGCTILQDSTLRALEILKREKPRGKTYQEEAPAVR